MAISNILFQSSSHLIERKGSFRSCHLFALNPELFLQEVNTNSFLVAFGEGAPAISGKEKSYKNKSCTISLQKCLDNTSGSCWTCRQHHFPRSAPAEVCVCTNPGNSSIQNIYEKSMWTVLNSSSDTQMTSVCPRAPSAQKWTMKTLNRTMRFHQNIVTMVAPLQSSS